MDNFTELGTLAIGLIIALVFFHSAIDVSTGLLTRQKWNVALCLTIAVSAAVWAGVYYYNHFAH